MKRFHLHLNVTDLNANIAFFSTLFDQPPERQEDDYAKWMLDDPAINFAISTRAGRDGVDHLGFQVDTDTDLSRLRELAGKAADGKLVDQRNAACCYSRSDKYWSVDPAGLPWELFTSLESIPVFGENTAISAASGNCCAPPIRASAGAGGFAVQLPGKQNCCGDNDCDN